MLIPKRGKNNKYGYVNPLAEDIWVIKPMYYSAGEFDEEYQVAICELMRYNFIIIDKNNKNITGAIYSNISKPRFGRAITITCGKRNYEVINLKTGTSEYGQFSWLSTEIEKDGHIDCCIHDKYGAINLLKGKKIPCQYDSLVNFKGEDYGSTTKLGKYGAIDWDNNEIIPFEYTSLEIYGVFAIVSTDLYGILRINKHTKEGEKNFSTMLDFKYQRISVMGKDVRFEKVKTIPLEELANMGENIYGL